MSPLDTCKRIIEVTGQPADAAMPYMNEDMKRLAAAAVGTLQSMTDTEFAEMEFLLTDEE